MPTIDRSTLRYSLSVSMPVGVYGVAFGAASIAAGLSVLQTCLLSLLTFTGASQFAAVGVVAAGGSPLSAIGAATILGTRNTLYGIQMKQHLNVRGWRQVIAAHITIDESTGVALSQVPRGETAVRQGFWLTGVGVYVFWNLFTLLGALGTKAMGNPASWGLDVAVPAAFLGLLWPRLTTTYVRIVAAVSVLFALVITPFLPAGVPIVSCALVAIVMGWRKQ